MNKDAESGLSARLPRLFFRASLLKHFSLYLKTKTRCLSAKYIRFSHVRFIKNDDGISLTRYEEILNKWREYFYKLANETHARKINLRKK